MFSKKPPILKYSVQYAPSILTTNLPLHFNDGQQGSQKRQMFEFIAIAMLEAYSCLQLLVKRKKTIFG